MPQIDRAPPPVSLKIVYYGPSGVGKTTTLRRLSARLHHQPASRLLSFDAPDASTLYFDILPIGFAVAGQRILLRLYSVPGQPMHRHTRRLLLRSADGVVLLGQTAMTEPTAANAPLDGAPAPQHLDEAALSELRTNLRECGITVESLPVVVQASPFEMTDDAPLVESLLSIVRAAWPAASLRCPAMEKPASAEAVSAALQQVLQWQPVGDATAGSPLRDTSPNGAPGPEPLRVPCGPQPLAALWSARTRSGIPSGGAPRS